MFDARILRNVRIFEVLPVGVRHDLALNVLNHEKRGLGVTSESIWQENG